MPMCEPFLIRSWADPTREYELADLGKFRELYRPGYFIARGPVPEGADLSNDEVAPWLKPQPEAAPPAEDDAPAEAPSEPTLADHEV